MQSRIPFNRIGAAAGLLVLLGLAAAPAEAQDAAEASFPLAPPARYVTDVDVSEETQSRVQDSLKSTLLAGVRRFNWALAASSLTDDFRGRFPSLEEGGTVADDLLAIRRYEPDRLPVLDREGLLAALRAHVGTWVSVDRASWQMFEFLLAPAGDRAFARAHVQLGGPDRDRARTVIEATVAAELVRSERDTWRIRRLDVTDGFRAHNPAPPFQDITDAVGLHFNRSPGERQFAAGRGRHRDEPDRFRAERGGLEPRRLLGHRRHRGRPPQRPLPQRRAGRFRAGSRCRSEKTCSFRASTCSWTSTATASRRSPGAA